jgi:hypothetical protein
MFFGAVIRGRQNLPFRLGWETRRIYAPGFGPIAQGDRADRVGERSVFLRAQGTDIKSQDRNQGDANV